MNKSEMVVHLSRQTKLKKKDCLNCINAITSLIRQSVKNGESVNLKEFGSFSVKYRKEKMTYNPITKKNCVISAHKVPAFKATEHFKQAVNS